MGWFVKGTVLEAGLTPIVSFFRGLTFRIFAPRLGVFVSWRLGARHFGSILVGRWNCPHLVPGTFVDGCSIASTYAPAK